LDSRGLLHGDTRKRRIEEERHGFEGFSGEEARRAELHRKGAKYAKIEKKERKEKVSNLASFAFPLCALYAFAVNLSYLF
jgi:hypothetical protein